MAIETLLFYFFSAVALFAGVRVISARNPVHAALNLVLAFFSVAGIWLLLEAEFLAIALVLVYVGAVMVLFLFVVMMIDINIERMRENFWRWFPFGLLLAAVMVGEMVAVLGDAGVAATGAGVARHAADYSNTKELGRLIYTDYVYAFELAAVLLLVAIVAAIALTLRRRPDTKRQTVGEQLKVKRDERVRLISMPAEARVPAEGKQAD